MLQALLVTFREGVEAFLIVGVITAYLQRTGRAGLVRGVRIGLGASVVTCLVGAWLWLQIPNQPLYEGIAALMAASFVGALLWQTLRVGRGLKVEIEKRVGHVIGAVADAGPVTTRAIAGVAAVTALLVTREGLEAIFYLGVQALASRAVAARGPALLIVAGAVVGLALAGALSWGWTRFAPRLNLGVVLRVTALFLGLFLLQLLVYGVHELAESGVIQGSQSFHDATEVLGPDGRIGHFISYSLLGAPLLYVFWARRARRARHSAEAATT